MRDLFPKTVTNIADYISKSAEQKSNQTFFSRIK
jgi:hypothetical protein